MDDSATHRNRDSSLARDVRNVAPTRSVMTTPDCAAGTKSPAASGHKTNATDAAVPAVSSSMAASSTLRTCTSARGVSVLTTQIR